MNTSVGSFDHWSRIIPALVASGLGAMFYNILPLYVGATQDSFNLSNIEAGTLGTAFFAGYNLATFSAFFWIQKVDWRKATVLWLVVTLVGLLLGLLAANFYSLLMTVFISGLGFSALYGLGTRILADTKDPSRWYGIKVAVEVVPGACLLLALPSTLLPTMGVSGVIWGMIIMVLVLSAGLLTMPSSGKGDSDQTPESGLKEASDSLKPLTHVWLALICTCIYFGAASAIWSFLERMGSTGGLSQTDVGNTLALTLVFASLGSLVTGWLGSSIGNVKPFLMSIFVLAISLAVLATFETNHGFSLGACLFSFSFGVGVPFAVAEVARRDPDGRFVMLSVTAIGVGAMIGPLLGGALIADQNYNLLCTAVFIMMLFGGSLMCFRPTKS
jgi:predicted MFS family arabinose efflux permease